MYSKYLKQILFPIILLLVSLAILVYNFAQTGDFILRNIDLKGGTLIKVGTDSLQDTTFIEKMLIDNYGSAFVSNIQAGGSYALEIQVEKDVDVNGVLDILKDAGVQVNSFSSESIGSFLGNLFFEQVVYILSAGFLLMSIVIFLIYRNPVTSFGIVFASLANIITTLAVTTVLGIKISFAGFAAILMLIAYTVDTNIVLTNKVLRSTPENFRSQYKKALSTGLTLIATITATMAIVAVFSPSNLLLNVSQVLIIGFVFDLPYTWLFNSGILEWWVNRRVRS